MLTWPFNLFKAESQIALAWLLDCFVTSFVFIDSFSTFIWIFVFIFCVPRGLLTFVDSTANFSIVSSSVKPVAKVALIHKNQQTTKKEKGRNYIIQAGAFSLSSNALKQMNKIKTKGLDVQMKKDSKRKLHLVYLGAFSTASEANKVMSSLKKLNRNSSFVIKEN